MAVSTEKTIKNKRREKQNELYNVTTDELENEVQQIKSSEGENHQKKMGNDENDDSENIKFKSKSPHS